MSQELLDFLNNSPTPFHATAQMASRLMTAGFKALSECDSWRLRPGDKCFVIRENSSLIAFQVGTDITGGFQIAGAHTDSPALKLRMGAAAFADGQSAIPVDVYGGAIRSTWFDRPLGIAGIAGDQLVKSDGAMVILPTPPVMHLGAGAPMAMDNSGEFGYSVLLPGCNSLQKFYDLVGLGMTIDENDQPPSELYLYDATPATCISNEWVNAPRLDNLLSCYCAMKQLIQCSGAAADFTRVMACFDLEEVGSGNRAGANSNFLEMVLRRITIALSKKDPAECLYRALAASVMLSIDAAHAFNPNAPQLFDSAYTAYAGKGVVLKRNISQRYATTYSGERYLTTLSAEAGVPLQRFEVRAGGRCGGTIGPMAACRLGMVTIDIGLPILAMHSLRETASLSDVDSLSQLLTQFWN